MKQLIYTTGVFETELKVWPHGEDVGELIAITSPLLDWSGDVIYN